ncbi:putative HECT-type ubiquitin ligase-interacting protein creD [Colletotrichum sidae]|uniref:Putative HECT-type ubiquitin ligase-interacting protein creD n=1 Tax=Colletotrichum sidae TaxID=1347389 RepID=A0A4R8T2G7_9PEZI|nr:putative HECT-type ubiquitin ligase-interacting protein creD [Colletotrichum sidae]
MISFLSRLTGGDGKACLKIKLQHDFVFLRGSAAEAVEQPLSGTISLSLPNGQRVDGVRLRMSGFLRCSHNYRESDPMPSSFRTVRVLEHESPPFVFDHGLKVPAETPSDTDTYEWPFEIMIPGDTPETFRGCSRCSIAYQLTATTIRNKNSSSTPQAYRPVRISRTLGNSAFELMDASTVEGTWADKVRYSISIGHRAVALATAIPLEMRLTPLSDETRFSTVRCELLEEHRFQLGSRPVASAFLGDRTVAEWVAPVENHEPGCEYTMAEKLGLPAEPKRCSPDVDTNGVEISHKLHVVVDVTAANDATFKASGRCQVDCTMPRYQ